MHASSATGSSLGQEGTVCINQRINQGVLPVDAGGGGGFVQTKNSERVGGGVKAGEWVGDLDVGCGDHLDGDVGAGVGGVVVGESLNVDVAAGLFGHSATVV